MGTLVEHLTQIGGEALLLQTTDDSLSCLHLAAHCGHRAVAEHVARLPCVGRLLPLEARDGPTALELAAAAGHAGVCEVLRAAASRCCADGM